MRKRNGVYQYRGHLAFRAAARAHEKLFPDIKTINGGSRRMAAIYEALDKAYTDGIEDALHFDDATLARMRRRILDAQYFGLAQRRERVFVVRCPGDGADPAEVLFERDGVQRHSPPRREARESVAHDVAPSLTSSGRGVERGGG